MNTGTKKKLIDYVTQMIGDNKLDNKTKIELLDQWENKLQVEISNTILHSTELLEYNEIIEHINISRTFVKSIGS